MLGIGLALTGLKLLNELNAWVTIVNRFLPYALFLAIMPIAAAMHLLNWHRDRPATNERD